MKSFTNKVTAFMISALFAFASAGSAFADSASSQATAKITELEQHKTTLAGIRGQVATFKIKSSYCEYFHKDDKRSDEAALKRLSDRVASEMRAVSQIRRTLIITVTRNQAARTALDQVLPGGSGTIVDGSLFRPFNRMRTEINRLLAQKRAELKAAATRPCGSAADDDSQQSMPGFVVQNPLTDVPTAGTYEDVAQVSVPGRLCHRDEKREWLDRITALRQKAQANERIAEKFRDKLRQLEAQVKVKRQHAWNAADAAAKFGDTTALNNNTMQLKAYDVALKKLAAGIRQAVADQSKWRNVDLQLRNDWEAVQAMPISDCLKGKVTPLTTMGFSAYDDLPASIPAISLEGAELKAVEFISVPAKVCFESIKDNYVMKAGKQQSNASHNESLWNERLAEIATQLYVLSNNPNASADLVSKLTNARREARKESNKWSKISDKTDAIVKKAMAIVVEDCSGPGGKTEIGRLDPGFTGLPNEIPVPDLRPYDLPNIPERICSWEELEALRARAAKAREVSAHNRREWGERMVALGKAYTDAFSTGIGFEAKQDASAQYDYWSKQQDEAHRVYWTLMEMKHENCEQPIKKTSMGSPMAPDADSHVGGQNASGGSFKDALQNARNTAPSFNSGGGSSGFSPIGNEYPPVYGYPDFEKERLLREIRGETGFDGSEAEHALEETLRNVEHMKVQQPHSHAGEVMTPSPSGKKETQSEGYEPTNYPADNTERTKTSNSPAQISPKPVSKTKIPAEPKSEVSSGKMTAVPAPPLVLTGPNNQVGQPKEISELNGVDLKLETQPIEYRNGSEESMHIKQPGLPKYAPLNGPRPTPESDDALSKTILEDAREKTNSGTMIRVEPPRLVIPVGATGRVNGATPPPQQEQVEVVGGQ